MPPITKSQGTETKITSLPHDVLAEVFKKLPATDCFVAGRVCRDFREPALQRDVWREKHVEEKMKRLTPTKIAALTKPTTRRHWTACVLGTATTLAASAYGLALLATQEKDVKIFYTWESCYYARKTCLTRNDRGSCWQDYNTCLGNVYEHAVFGTERRQPYVPPAIGLAVPALVLSLVVGLGVGGLHAVASSAVDRWRQQKLTRADLAVEEFFEQAAPGDDGKKSVPLSARLVVVRQAAQHATLTKMLHQAIERNDVEGVERLLEAGADPIAQLDNHTAYEKAAHLYGDVRTAKQSEIMNALLSPASDPADIV